MSEFLTHTLFRFKQMLQEKGSLEGDLGADLLPPLLCLSQDLFFEGSNAGHARVLLHPFAHSFLFRLFSQFSVVFPNLIREIRMQNSS